MRIKEIKIQWMKDFCKKMLIKYGNDDPLNMKIQLGKYLGNSLTYSSLAIVSLFLLNLDK